MHRTEDMLRILTGLSLHFPQAGRSAAQIAALAQDWADDLAGFPLAVVERGAKYARRESEFFPSTARFMEFCRRAYNEYDLHRQALLPAPVEDADSEENRQRGLKYCAAILNRLRAGAGTNGPRAGERNRKLQTSRGGRA